MPFTLLPMSDTAIDANRNAIAGIYASAFKVDPEAAGQFMTGAFDHHRWFPGFMGRIAVDVEGVVAGFVYGYHSQSGQWWHDLVRPALASVSHGHWLDDTFEFVELAVAPNFQGQRLGSRLHDSLLGTAPERTALLSTLAGNTSATRLYRSRGWITLLPDFKYFPEGDKTLLMGLRMEEFRHARSNTALG